MAAVAFDVANICIIIYKYIEEENINKMLWLWEASACTVCHGTM